MRVGKGTPVGKLTKGCSGISGPAIPSNRSILTVFVNTQVLLTHANCDMVAVRDLD